ncbi:Lcl domain-containing protein [Vibrio coralliilyticus]|uniref:Lcl domain-containing protein n=1 Tax=Vibrio coralliilyticus TaxID=190893 RepID=UPI001E2CBF8C|nr:DUF1566 domain-containing protein [Vibrio coralliilyticus]MCC2525785.1 DUF1566 domain-containing protein [Vibrio coralliilyticus]
MKVTNPQRIKRVAPLFAALLLSACGGDESESLLSQPEWAGYPGQVCDSPYDQCDSDSDDISSGLETAQEWDDNDPNTPVENGNGDDDGDGISNGQEVSEGWDQNDANDPVINGHEDKDGDGIANGLETVQEWDDSDPNNPVENGNEDDDGDGITNGQEVIEGWDLNDPNNPVDRGNADNDGDGFPAGQEWLENWDDNDANNPITALNVNTPTLVLDNAQVTPGMGLQASIEFSVEGEPETYSTLDVPDSRHVTWQVLETDGTALAELVPTSEGYVTIPGSEEALAFADAPLVMQANFLEGGWFEGQPTQEKIFTVTLAAVSESEVSLLINGEPLEGSIYVGETVVGQATVYLADGSEIVAPADSSLGTWSVAQQALDIGVIIDPVTGELDTSSVDTERLGDEFTFDITWSGAGSLSGGQDSQTVILTTHGLDTLEGGACGGQLNDTDRTNATGPCLKIATAALDGQELWFTSSPSLAMMESIGYTEQNLPDNSGQTYANVWVENGVYGPEGEFAGFSQHGQSGGQFDRYCADLATRNYAGKEDWRRPTTEELSALYQQRGNMYYAFGWPTVGPYWSSTADESNFGNVDLINGVVGSYSPDTNLYASCVSDSSL